jgi:hypothetical protein
MLVGAPDEDGYEVQRMQCLHHIGHAPERQLALQGASAEALDQRADTDAEAALAQEPIGQSSGDESPLAAVAALIVDLHGLAGSENERDLDARGFLL